MTVRDYAERILLAESLAEKLAPPPQGLVLDPPQKGSYRTPDSPGRPAELRPRGNRDSRTKIPSLEQLSSEEHRSVLLHFFCNHELLAVELMALALLKFPDAPDAFRRGLLHTLQEEQEHTRLYLDRMAATGTSFGDHSLSRMIWDHIAEMNSPIEYVSRLSLTFEQSNLDYAKHYSQAFSRIGDQETSSLLDKIYKDEIAHVGYGLKWLRRFKKEQESDWDAWHRSLAHPLTPIRAKAPEGPVPFNEEGRRKAGLKDDFIDNLKIYQRSRGRTPFLHLFNPNCEAHTAASATGRPYQPNQASLHLEQDLEALILANAHPDDVALLRHPPTAAHLAQLKEAGLSLPEILPLSEATITETLAERKLGGFRPWAWSPEMSTLLKPLAHHPTENTLHPWRESLPSPYFGKSLTQRAAKELRLANNESHPFTSLTEAQEFLTNHRNQGPFLLKPEWACAGKGQLIVDEETDELKATQWLTRTLQNQGALVIEPFLTRQFDFSALYEIDREGKTRFLSFTQLLTDNRGHYLGTRVAPKIGNLFPHELTVLFHQNVVRSAGRSFTGPHFYKEILPRRLGTLLPDYHGPVAIDAFFYTDSEENTALRPIVEINPRCSMGRIAHHLRRELAPNEVGELLIHRLQSKQRQPTGLLLNDPAHARAFQAIWRTPKKSQRELS